MRIKHDTIIGPGLPGLPGAMEHAFERTPAYEPLVAQYRAVKGECEVILEPARSEPERLAIFEMRQQAYRAAGMDYLLAPNSAEHPAADEYDASAVHLYCYEKDRERDHDEGRIVGSVRHAAALDGRWESPEITRLSTLTPIAPHRLLQLGRLVVAPDCRGRMLSELLVWASADWLYRLDAFRGFFSVCAPRLARFYEHFGTTIVEGADTTLAERDHKVYSLIYARYEDCRDTLHRYLSEQGWELHYPAPALA